MLLSTVCPYFSDEQFITKGRQKFVFLEHSTLKKMFLMAQYTQDSPLEQECTNYLPSMGHIQPATCFSVTQLSNPFTSLLWSEVAFVFQPGLRGCDCKSLTAGPFQICQLLFKSNKCNSNKWFILSDNQLLFLENMSSFTCIFWKQI